MLLNRRSLLCGFLWAFAILNIGYIDCNNINFKIKKGQRVAYGATEILRVAEDGISMVKCAARCHEDCGLFEVNKVIGLCVLYMNKLYVYNHGIHLTEDEDWSVGVYAPLDDEEWVLAFRGQKEIGVSVYSVWNEWAWSFENQYFVQESLPQACLRFYNYGSCREHFRSQILDSRWSYVREVRLSFFKSGTEAAYAVFNATDTERDTWLRTDRITASTWGAAVQNDKMQRETLAGVCNPDVCRRFLLLSVHSTCSTVSIYTMVLDEERDRDLCVIGGAWSAALGTITSFPNFFFSPTAGRASMASGAAYPVAEKADVMAVWVKIL